MCLPRGKGHCTSTQTNPCTECILFCFYFCFLKDEIRTQWRAAVIWKLGSGVPLFSICNEICRIVRPQPMSGRGFGLGFPAYLTYSSPWSEWVKSFQKFEVVCFWVGRLGS